MTIQLDAQLRLLAFSIHGLFGMRESQICVLGEARDRATICWRHRAQHKSDPSTGKMTSRSCGTRRCVTWW